LICNGADRQFKRSNIDSNSSFFVFVFQQGIEIFVKHPNLTQLEEEHDNPNTG